ncbi:hypothetical protein ASE74_24205 [Pedobacter sp. Leaf216]|uniref:hypothetical protein n=1 Tax=Pedobacter sp. Leaf216 TaxID=1735684 RepID=UPI0006FACB28|nr:hypothetical protein [Pedobacter sp. Leaf216]KQM68208.1 hypothetical protein ASE74_24205 [Pedobacter sp. Leaf216]
MLEQILLEGRKELLLRGLRWIDVKRLNKEGAGISFTRTSKGIVYNLLANSTGFTLPIPEQVVELANLPQNP